MVHKLRLLVLVIMLAWDAWWWHTQTPGSAASLAYRVWITLLAGGAGVTACVIVSVALALWIAWGLVYRKREEEA